MLVLGNAWAAAGMLRVLGTIQHSPFPKKFKNEQKDLQKWITEIMDAMYPWLVSPALSCAPFILLLLFGFLFRCATDLIGKNNSITHLCHT